MSKKLTDTEVHERLVNAADAVGSDQAETSHGQTALDAARTVLTGLQFGIVAVNEKTSSQPD